MARLYFFMAGLLIATSLLNAQWEKGKSFRITNKVTVENDGNHLNKLFVVMPLPQTNQYQEIKNINTGDGSVLDITESDDKYIRWYYRKKDLDTIMKKEFLYSFDVTIHKFTFNFNKIDGEYPYDTTSVIYKHYTGVSGESIDPGNETIMRIGNTIWAQSTGIVDYARRCYEFVAKHYNYIKPSKGLKNILANGGGDCRGYSGLS